MKFPHSTRANQRGSALLIVFVFAAIVAIMLFSEMPVVIFEAQRNKEQLLIDRGNEYTQAVKLYLRKTGQYPPSIDALENTNRVRFLRKKFKDPFTDKADWRLLHAGPNGILIDSKLKQLQTPTGPNSSLGTFNNSGNNQASPFGGTNGFGGANSGFGNTGNSSGFGGGFSGGNAPNPITTNQPPANVRASNGAENPLFQGGVASNPQGIDPNQLPTRAQMDNAMAQASAQNPNVGNPAYPQNPSGPRSPFPVGTNGSATGVIDPSQAAGAFASSGGFQNSGDASNPNAAVAGLVSNPNAPTPQTNGFSNSTGQGSSPFGNNSFGNNSFGNNSFGNSPSGGNSFGSSSTTNPGNSNSPGGFGSSTFGNTQNGNLAGVASKVERHSIKSVNDQKDYSLWEFYYDQSKDPARNGATALSSLGGNGSNQPGNSTAQPGNAFGQQSAFGNQSSSFGNRPSAFGNQSSAFGNQGTNGSTNSGFGGFGGGFGATSNSQGQNGQPAPNAQQQPVPPQPPPQ